MKIICDECKGVIKYPGIQLQKRTIDSLGMVVKTFFTCPTCGFEHIVLVADPEVTRLINAGKKDEARERATMLRVKYFGLSK